MSASSTSPRSSPPATNPAGYALARVDLAAPRSGRRRCPHRRPPGARGPAGRRREAPRSKSRGSPPRPDSIAPGMAGGYAFLAPPDTALRPVDRLLGGGRGGTRRRRRVSSAPPESDAEDAIPAAGWSIDDVRLDRDARLRPATSPTMRMSLMIRVSGSRINSPATGMPEIAGTAAVGRRLQASPGSVADPDGVSSPLAYRWIRVDAGRPRPRSPARPRAATCWTPPIWASGSG